MSLDPDELEIRVDGKAVDPMTYFRAGTELTAIL